MYKRRGIRYNFCRGADRNVSKDFILYDTEPGPIKNIPIEQYLKEKEKEQRNE